MYQEKKRTKKASPMTDYMVVVPDRYAEHDLIGYSAYGAGLVKMIQSVQSDGSFTIGVFGQWGQGKTSMLRQIKHTLDEFPNQSTNSSGDRQPIITAWFNPWQFTKERHIIIPFFHTLASYFKEYQETNKSITTEAVERIKIFLKELAHVPIALAYGLESQIKIPLLLKLKFKFNNKAAIDESRRYKKELEQEVKTDTDNLIEDYESLYYRLITRLEKASTELNVKVVVFIDDLDRCLPEKAVELLEGVKVLLDIPGFVFVIGVAREVIERGIRFRYHALYRDFPEQKNFIEEEYLDKIIQFPFTLPAPDKKRLKDMIGDHLKNIPQVESYLPIIHKALGDNPRCLKRFVNNLSYTFWVAQEKTKESLDEEEFHPGLLVKMTLLAFLFPRLYHIVGKTPSHLLRIQKFLQFKPELDELNKSGELSEQEQNKKLSELNIQHPEDFIEIKALQLFERPRLDTILIILGTNQCEPSEKMDDGLYFKDEIAVRKYVSLLIATSKSEESYQISVNTIRDTISSRMVKIPAGKIRLKDENSEHEFTTKINDFLIDKYPVTQDIYREITGESPGHFEGDDRPVETVSWFDAVKFCNLLSEKAGYNPAYSIDGKKVLLDIKSNGFRLPTEAEWEYACRAGSTGERYGELDDIAWYEANSGGQTHSVGQKLPNNWGLYDMLGNVWENCWDWYGEYPQDEIDIWSGPENGENRILRGGSWLNESDLCRCNYRLDDLPANRDGYSGFRLARSL